MKPLTSPADIDIEAQAAAMLRRIGWSKHDWKQVEAYARMPAAQKIGQMFRIRRGALNLLEKRLRREHPEQSDYEIKLLLVEHLALLKRDLSDD